MKKIIVIAGLALTLTACASMQADRELNETIAQAEKEIANIVIRVIRTSRTISFYIGFESQ